MQGTVDNKRNSARQVPNQIASFVAWKQVLEVQCTSVDDIHVVPGAKDSTVNVLARTTKSLSRGDLMWPITIPALPRLAAHASGTAPGIEIEILLTTRRILAFVGPETPPAPAPALRNPSWDPRSYLR